MLFVDARPSAAKPAPLDDARSTSRASGGRSSAACTPAALSFSTYECKVKANSVADHG